MSETVDVPADALADHARRQACLDSDPDVLAPETVDVDVWDTIKEADVQDVSFEDGDLHVWMETTTAVDEKVARASRLQPAEYRTHHCDTFVSIMWDFDPESAPEVTIEVNAP